MRLLLALPIAAAIAFAGMVATQTRDPVAQTQVTASLKGSN
jgi:hypothetical protein